MAKITDEERQRINRALEILNREAPKLAIYPIIQPRSITFHGSEFYADVGNSQTFFLEGVNILNPRMAFTGQDRHVLYSMFRGKSKTYRLFNGDWQRDIP